jgi:hypothetical protein
VDWGNERYVRLYIRDTTTWKILGWDGQCMLMQLLRKVDRCGFLSLDGLEPWEGAALHTGASEEVARRGVEVLLRKCVLEHRGQSLVFPNYLAAQECVKSDALRAKEYRERRLVTESDAPSRDVTGESRTVTQPSRGDHPRHAASRRVTPNQPRHAEPATPGGAGGDAPDGAAPAAQPSPKPKATRKRTERDDMFDLVRDTFEAAHTAAHGCPEGVDGSLVSKVVNWAMGLPESDRSAMIKRAVAGFFADGYWLREGRHPFVQLAKAPGGFAANAPTPKVRVPWLGNMP